MQFVNVRNAVTYSLLLLGLASATVIAQAQSSGGGPSNVGAGNVEIIGAGGGAINGNSGAAGSNSQGGTYTAGTTLSFTLQVYGVQGGGSCAYDPAYYCPNYVLASCASYRNGVGTSIYSSKSSSDIQAQFNWTPPGSGSYSVQCEVQYVPGSTSTGGAAYGVATTGEILFTVN